MPKVTALQALKIKRDEAALELTEAESGSATEKALLGKIDTLNKLIADIRRENGTHRPDKRQDGIQEAMKRSKRQQRFQSIIGKGSH
jgi:hypothetical protein